MLRIPLGCLDTGDKGTAALEMVYARLDAMETNHFCNSQITKTPEYMGRIFPKKQMVYSRLDASGTYRSGISRVLFHGASATRR
jgi:hypothetical protein